MKIRIHFKIKGNKAQKHALRVTITEDSLQKYKPTEVGIFILKGLEKIEKMKILKKPNSGRK